MTAQAQQAAERWPKTRVEMAVHMRMTPRSLSDLVKACQKQWPRVSFRGGSPGGWLFDERHYSNLMEYSGWLSGSGSGAKGGTTPSEERTPPLPDDALTRALAMLTKRGRKGSSRSTTRGSGEVISMGRNPS